jgi:sporulation protein YlmC with PRC-barrel domain
MTAPTDPRDRGGRRIDAALQLMDRQIVDSNGRLAGKVDDVELARRADGTLAVTAILLGPGALGPRLHGLIGRLTVAVWLRLHPGDDPTPGRIPMDQVSQLGSAVRVGGVRQELPAWPLEAWAERHIVTKLPGAGPSPGEPRAGERRRAGQPAEPTEVGAGDLRLSHLIGASVSEADGAPFGHVADVRLAQVGPPRGAMAEFVVESLLVSPRRAGTLFGYERRREQGPLLVRVAVRRLHRGAFFTRWQDVADTGHDVRRITLRSGAQRRPPDVR